MPVINEWYVEGKIILTRLVGDVTLEELEQSSAVGTEMIASGDIFVFGVVDMTDLKKFPRSLTDLRHLASLPRSDKLRWIIVCGIPNPIVNFLATSFAHFINTSYKFVKTRDEALKMAMDFAGLSEEETGS